MKYATLLMTSGAFMTATLASANEVDWTVYSTADKTKMTVRLDERATVDDLAKALKTYCGAQGDVGRILLAGREDATLETRAIKLHDPDGAPRVIGEVKRRSRAPSPFIKTLPPKPPESSGRARLRQRDEQKTVEFKFFRPSPAGDGTATDKKPKEKAQPDPSPVDPYTTERGKKYVWRVVDQPTDRCRLEQLFFKFE